MRGWRARPYRITEGGLAALARQEEAEFREKLEALSRPLGEEGSARQAWQACLDYYGVAGLRNELTGILTELEGRPPKGAAMLRNRLTTPQHVALWRDLLPRIIAGSPASAPAELRSLVAEWFERTSQRVAGRP